VTEVDAWSSSVLGDVSGKRQAGTDAVDIVQRNWKSIDSDDGHVIHADFRQRAGHGANCRAPNRQQVNFVGIRSRIHPGSLQQALIFLRLARSLSVLEFVNFAALRCHDVGLRGASGRLRICRGNGLRFHFDFSSRLLNPRCQIFVAQKHIVNCLAELVAVFESVCPRLTASC